MSMVLLLLLVVLFLFVVLLLLLLLLLLFSFLGSLRACNGWVGGSERGSGEECVGSGRLSRVALNLMSEPLSLSEFSSSYKSNRCRVRRAKMLLLC